MGLVHSAPCLHSDGGGAPSGRRLNLARFSSNEYTDSLQTEGRTLVTRVFSRGPVCSRRSCSHRWKKRYLVKAILSSQSPSKAPHNPSCFNFFFSFCKPFVWLFVNEYWRQTFPWKKKGRHQLLSASSSKTEWGPNVVWFGNSSIFLRGIQPSFILKPEEKFWFCFEQDGRNDDHDEQQRRLHGAGGRMGARGITRSGLGKTTTKGKKKTHKFPRSFLMRSSVQ